MEIAFMTLYKQKQHFSVNSFEGQFAKHKFTKFISLENQPTSLFPYGFQKYSDPT